MTRIRRSVKLVIEREREIILRSRGLQQCNWCPDCDAEVVMASIDIASREVGLGELAIYQLINIRSVHFRQDHEGRVLVCLESLLRIPEMGKA